MILYNYPYYLSDDKILPEIKTPRAKQVKNVQATLGNRDMICDIDRVHTIFCCRNVVICDLGRYRDIQIILLCELGSEYVGNANKIIAPAVTNLYTKYADTLNICFFFFRTTVTLHQSLCHCIISSKILTRFFCVFFCPFNKKL